MHFYIYSVKYNFGLETFCLFTWNRTRENSPLKLQKQHLDSGSHWCSKDAWLCNWNLLERTFQSQVFNPIIISGALCVYPYRIYIWVWSVGPDSVLLCMCMHKSDLSLSFLSVSLCHFWLSFCCASCLWSHLGTRESRRLLMRSQNIRSLPLPTGPSWLRLCSEYFCFL